MGVKIITFSFDDGTVSDRRLVELLNRYHLRATFCLCSGEWGHQHEIDHLGIRCDHSEITKEEVAALYLGHEVACHTVTHPEHLELLPESALFDEIERNRTELEGLVGYPVCGLAYPWGRYGADVLRFLKEKTPILYGRTAASTYSFEPPEDLLRWPLTCRLLDERLLDVWAEFCRSKKDRTQVFTAFCHSFECNKFEGAWDRLEDFLQHVAAQPDIFCLTQAETAHFLRAGTT